MRLTLAIGRLALLGGVTSRIGDRCKSVPPFAERSSFRHPQASQDAAHHAWSAHTTISWAPTGIFTGNCPCGFGLVGLVVLGRAARVRCVPAQQGEQSGMINPKSRRRSEKRLPSKSLEPQADLPPLPPPDELITRTTKTLVWNADPDLEVYVVDRRTLDSQERLVDFALVVTARHGPDEEWREVIKIDTAHRTVHVHQSGLRDTASVPPDCRVNIDRAHAWAHAYAWDTATTLMEVPDG